MQHVCLTRPAPHCGGVCQQQGCSRRCGARNRQHQALEGTSIAGLVPTHTLWCPHTPSLTWAANLRLQSYAAVAEDIAASLSLQGLDVVTMPDGVDLVERLKAAQVELVSARHPGPGSRQDRTAQDHVEPSTPQHDGCTLLHTCSFSHTRCGLNLCRTPVACLHQLSRCNPGKRRRCQHIMTPILHIP